MGNLAGIGKTGRKNLGKVLERNPKVITSETVSEALDISRKEASFATVQPPINAASCGLGT